MLLKGKLTLMVVAQLRATLLEILLSQSFFVLIKFEKKKIRFLKNQQLFEIF